MGIEWQGFDPEMVFFRAEWISRGWPELLSQEEKKSGERLRRGEGCIVGFWGGRIPMALWKADLAVTLRIRVKGERWLFMRNPISLVQGYLHYRLA
jgi:hypothetical protein